MHGMHASGAGRHSWFVLTSKGFINLHFCNKFYSKFIQNSFFFGAMGRDESSCLRSSSSLLWKIRFWVSGVRAGISWWCYWESLNNNNQGSGSDEEEEEEEAVAVLESVGWHNPTFDQSELETLKTDSAWHFVSSRHPRMCFAIGPGRKAEELQHLLGNDWRKSFPPSLHPSIPTSLTPSLI